MIERERLALVACSTSACLFLKFHMGLLLLCSLSAKDFESDCSLRTKERKRKSGVRMLSEKVLWQNGVMENSLVIDVEKDSAESLQKVNELKVKSSRENLLQKELANRGKWNCL